MLVAISVLGLAGILASIGRMLPSISITVQYTPHGTASLRGAGLAAVLGAATAIKAALGIEATATTFIRLESCFG